MAAPVVHLNGWPGTGKRTIGACLAERLGGRLIDNHLFLAPASAVYDRGDPRHERLRIAVRDLVFAAARDLPRDMPLILTDALADDAHGLGMIAAVRGLADARGAAFCPWVLTISPTENARRLAGPGRAERAKLTDPAVLTTLRETVTLASEGARGLDVTGLKAGEAADRIIDALHAF